MLDRLQNLLEDAAAADERLKVIRKRMEQGKAALADTAEYSDRLSNLLGEILAAHVEHLTQPKEKETICKQLLKEHYARINKVLANVQLDLDQQREIHIRPQQAAFPAERVQKVAHALEDPTVPLDTIRRRANAPVANVAKSFHDDYIQANAKFRAEAGLKCWIVRTTDGNCCKWCTEVAGRYEYGSEPGDVYRRHDNCGCTTVYENGRQRQDVWSKKKWEVPEAGAGAPKPTILTPAQGRALQAKHKPTVLTRGRPAVINQSKAVDLFNDYGVPSDAKITSQQIVEDLQTSTIGREIISFMENLPERITLDYKTVELDSNGLKIYGMEIDGVITIFMKNCENAERAARTVIHECTHRRFGIGESQWAESVCFAQELKHKYKRDYLTYAEKLRIIEAVVEGYPEYKWRKGGLVNGRRKKPT